MEYNLSSLKPEALFRFFEEISAIPRGNRELNAIAAYLTDFAEKHGLEYVRDKECNVFIRKPASAGREEEEPIILQAHIDMVWEKNAGNPHDFWNDPIRVFIKGDRLTANGTTLGGDDGIGVAMILAILDDSSLSHPPLECLLTANEETGMDGAHAIDASLIRGRKLINIDSEKEGEITAGCAGGIDLIHTLPFTRVANTNKMIKIEVKGLAGGHSGIDIHRGRSNAVRIMARILSRLYEDEVCGLAALKAGSKMNSIPRECFATVAVTDPARAKELILSFEPELRNELTADDKKFVLHVSRAAKEETCISPKDTRKLIHLLTLIPCDVLRMSFKAPGIVETSSNLARLRINDDDSVLIGVSARSLLRSRLDEVVSLHRALAKEFGTVLVESGRYPAWEYREGTELQKKFSESYARVSGGKKTTVVLIHAGLECGIFSEKLPGLDAISIGPDMSDIHTPRESLSISSSVRIYETVVDMLSRKD